MVDRTVVEILEQGHSYIIEGPNSKKHRRNRAHLKPLCHDGSSFQDPPKVQKKNPSKSDQIDSFQDPRPRWKKSVTFRNDPLIFESIPNRDIASKTSKPTQHSSHSSHMYIHPIHPHHHHQHSSHPERN